MGTKALDAPNGQNRKRLKILFLIFIGLSVAYAEFGQYIQTNWLQKIYENSKELPTMRQDLKEVKGYMKSNNVTVDIKAWINAGFNGLTNELQETFKNEIGKLQKKDYPQLITGSIKIENKNLPEEILQIKQEVNKNPSDETQIKLAHAYIIHGRYTLARQTFEIIMTTSDSYIANIISELMIRALRGGLGKKIASKELSLAYVVHWEEEPHYKMRAHLSNDGIKWIIVPLEPSNPAGSVIKYPMSQYIRIDGTPDPITSGNTPILYYNTIVVSIGLVNKNWELHHPYLLTQCFRMST